MEMIAAGTAQTDEADGVDDDRTDERVEGVTTTTVEAQHAQPDVVLRENPTV
jgi:hypothetical protein